MRALLGFMFAFMVLASARASAEMGPSSIEFGRKQWGTDDAIRSNAPEGGTLFSVWTKIPDPGSAYPWGRGNMDVYVLRGNVWYFRCLVGNTSANSPTDARYNANTMLFANPGETWVTDYSYYESGFGQVEAPLRDWVWVAWQVIVSPTSFTIRQWLKFGIDGEVFAAGESAVTFADVRTILIDKGWTMAAVNAWTPSDATSFEVGKDNGYLSYARMFALGTVPALAELDTIARSDSALTSAWADFRLDWVGGVPNLSDRSGHGRDLTIEAGGQLYEGLAGPSLARGGDVIPVPIPRFALWLLAGLLLATHASRAAFNGKRPVMAGRGD